MLIRRWWPICLLIIFGQIYLSFIFLDRFKELKRSIDTLKNDTTLLKRRLLIKY